MQKKLLATMGLFSGGMVVIWTHVKKVHVFDHSQLIFDAAVLPSHLNLTSPATPRYTSAHAQGQTTAPGLT